MTIKILARAGTEGGICNETVNQLLPLSPMDLLPVVSTLETERLIHLSFLFPKARYSF